MNIFVYGTLRPGQVNANLVADLCPEMRPARLDGFTLLASRGGSFPYAVPAAGAEVVGMVYVITDAGGAEALRRLDRLEGYRPGDPGCCHYLRVERRVAFADGTGGSGSAFVYIAGPRVDLTGLERVGSNWTRPNTRRCYAAAHQEGRM